ncbi:hypothetical protein L5515_012388 [Caenorhabditis briggsae]|uniref:Uncharacterized protein n=1 Tax=Caenorhabditis briggsae TaxID=6238 RepID=A0AAE9EXD1_CAEBR|nr:hypothetical protein L5515_012388 [Caenorhabditis briggsae]
MEKSRNSAVSRMDSLHDSWTRTSRASLPSAIAKRSEDSSRWWWNVCCWSSLEGLISASLILISLSLSLITIISLSFPPNF